MIRSLRLRFFLLVWPLVVVALVGLGSLLGRWSVVELGRVSMEVRSDRHAGAVTDQLVDSFAANGTRSDAAVAELLQRIATPDSLLLGAIVASRDRGLIASSLRSVQVESLTVGPGRIVSITAGSSSAGRIMRVKYQGTGHALDPADAPDPRYLVVLGGSAAGLTAPETRVDPGPMLTRRIALALIIGSVIAALVTLVLSGQLTGRVEKLAEATRSLGGGNLAARVPVKGGDEIAALATSFNEMAAGLEGSEAQRRRMISDVAHELRTPLTNLIALVEAARDGLRPTNGELLNSLSEEAALLNRLVDDLRDLALADAGDLVLARDRFELEPMVRRTAAAFSGNNNQVTVNVKESMIGTESVMVTADEHRLGQVLRNLIQNAVTHSPPGGTVTIRIDVSSSTVTISVIDQGAGIAAEHLPHIWERFYRADPSRARATGGMGLGLAVAKRLVEAMGGSIAVESTVGEGSVFTVRLSRES